MRRPRFDAARTAADHVVHRVAPLAPDWLVRVVAPKRVPVPWIDMVRFAASITVPLIVGLLLGQGPLGGFAAMGALLGAFGDKGGPFRRRAIRTAHGFAGGLAGLVAGHLLLDAAPPAVAVLTVVVLGAVSAIVSAGSAELSFAGLQMLVYLAVSSGPAKAVPLAPLVGLFLAGAAWSLLLSFVQARQAPDEDPPGTAVVRVLDALLELLDAVAQRQDADGLRRARRRLTLAIGRAYDGVATARAHAPGRRADLDRLARILSAAADLAATAVDAAQRDPVDTVSLGPHIAALRDRLAGGARLRRAAPAPVPSGAAGAALLAAVDRLERAEDATGPTFAGTAAARTRLRIRELLSGRSTLVFAARLALTAGTAELVTQLVPLTRSYWVLLTVAVVLKPDFGSVFARGVQRTLGTVVGVLIGALVIETVPAGPLLLLPVAVIAFVFPFAAGRNYGMLSTFITPLVLLLVDFSGRSTHGVGTGRLLDTLLGAAIVLLVGYLPWPGTWRPHLERSVAESADALGAWTRVALGHTPAEAVPARRRAIAALADSRSALQSALAEPVPAARAASAWFPLLTQLDQVGDALRDVAALGRGAVVPASDTAAVADALDALAAAVRTGAPLQEDPLPEEGPLAEVAVTVREARRLITGHPAPAG